MKNKQYRPDGYMPKISYYRYKVNKAIEQLDTDALEFYTGKLKYFIGRQQHLELFR